MNERKQDLTHIVGTFLIQAEGSFLNGAGLGTGEDKNVVITKTFSDFKDKVPYVSSQAWKRWLRNTFQEEYPDYPPAIIRQLHVNTKGNTDKIGTDNDPIKFPEDDIFGYMKTASKDAQKNQERENDGGLDDDADDSDNSSEETNKKNKKENVKSIMRPAPFSASILKSLRKNGWKGKDEAFVHLQEGSPQPYTTEFFNTQLQGIFSLNYSRLGVFRNEGDRIELDKGWVNEYRDKNIIHEEKTATGGFYRIVDNKRKERAAAILNALTVMRGGAKQAQFATDVAPKLIIAAGLNCGNLIFNDNLLDDTKEGPLLNIEALKEIIRDYKDRIITPVYIGVRTGYLSNEKDIKEKIEDINKEINPNKIIISTPINAIKELTKHLPL
jgi:CRISPR-associated protein Cst2